MASEDKPSAYIEFPGKLPAKHEILYMLLNSKGEFLSGEALGSRADISRPAVWKNIQALIEEGFPIQTARRKGYKIAQECDILIPPEISCALTTSRMGSRIFYTPRTGSTNNDAKSLADSAMDGTVFISEIQTMGKGRLGRQWESPKGGIFLSLILKPEIPPVKVPGLSLVVGYTVAKTVQSQFGLKALVKWPNDVLVSNHKIAGILCEMRAELDRVSSVIVGIGINANVETSHMPETVRERSTSISEEIGRPVDRNLLIATLLNTLEPCYGRFLESGLESFLPEIEKMLAYMGNPVMIHNAAFGPRQAQHGKLHGLDKEGRIILLTGDGTTRTFAAGDVSLRPKLR
ncbi:MAG: biotin--[acetyl-CoA-carboxylase] ligase [Bacillota bacterium]